MYANKGKAPQLRTQTASGSRVKPVLVQGVYRLQEDKGTLRRILCP